MKLQGALIEQYKELHQGKRYSDGRFLQRYVSDITKIVTEIPTQSILDYGSGKGGQYTKDRVHEAWGVMPTLFDPGVHGINHLPERTFDGVICTGVLEHIPRPEMDMAIGNLVRYADKWCFIIVGTAPTKKLLPDGRQAHVTLRPKKWWGPRIRNAFDGRAKVYLGYAP